jgi:hypothetical protein
MHRAPARTARLLPVILLAAMGPAFITTSPPAAAGPAASPEVRVNTTTASDQGSPSVAMDADGDYVVAWNSFDQDGSGFGVYSQRYNAAGVPQGSESLVNTATADNQFAPSVAMDADGDYVVAWTSYGQDGDSDGVYAQRYHATGTPWGSETQVNTYTIGHQHQASVAMDADGDYVITWAGYFLDGNGFEIYAQRYNATGTPQGAEIRVNTTTINDQTQPDVAMDADGDYVVTWTSADQDGSGSGVYAQRYDAAGTPLGTQVRVNTTTDSAQFDPSIAMDADGDYAVTWTSENQDGSGYGVYSQRYAAAGSPQGSETGVNTVTSSQQYQPTIAMDADGDYIVAWSSFGQDGSGNGIYAQRYNATGTPQGIETRINTTVIDTQLEPTVAMDADGDRVVTWTSGNQDGSGYGVYARRFRGPEAVDLRLTQSDNADPVAVDGRIVYRLRVSNLNDDADVAGIEAIDHAIGAANGVYVISEVPDGATLLSSSGTGWTCGPATTTVRCKLATTIAAGTSAPGLLLTYAAPDEAGPALHPARVYQSHVDPVSANDSEVESTGVLCSLEFATPSYSQTEAGSMVATVIRHGTGCGASGVSYATAAASATAVSDYTEVSGSLTWTDGDSTKTFSIPLVDDGLDEKTEQFRLLLTNPSGALLGTTAQATGLLLDNDDPPRINFSTTTGTAAEPGALVRLTVELSEISGQQVTVVLAKAGTATYLSDYYAPKRLTIPAGQLTAGFTIEVADDNAVEGNELAVIALAAPTAATLGTQKTYRLTITDDD